jgi:hypothetical protein
VKQQQGKRWGKSVVARLSEDLWQEFPGIRGFSARNIWYMRQYYLACHGNQKLQPMVAEIAWSHNLIILDKCKDEQEKDCIVYCTDIVINSLSISFGMASSCCFGVRRLYFLFLNPSR